MDGKKLALSILASGLAGQIISLIADIFPNHSGQIISLGMAIVGAANLYISPNKNGNGTISTTGIMRAVNAKIADEIKGTSPK